MKPILPSLLFGAALMLGSVSTVFAADTYKFDPTHTTVIWKAGHLGFSTPHGLFPMIEGTLVLDEAAPENSTVNVTIDTAQITTGIPKFNDHLKNADFFNVEKFPDATFKSTKVERTGDNTAKVTGDLTILGVTKPLTLDVTLNKKGEHPFVKKQAVGFSGTGTIKRSEYGMNYGIPNMPDDVQIVVEAEAILE